MRLRKKPLPFIANILLLFFLTVTATLVYQFVTLLSLPGAFDWATALLLVATTIFFVVLVVGVWAFDMEARMVLNRQGILIEPALFKSYTIPWEDIAELSLQERQGLRLIEYKLKTDSASYQARFQKKRGLRLRQAVGIEKRSGGFHGWLPVQSYRMEVKAPLEQYDVKVNRLFPVLRRYWLNPQARNELPET